MKAIAGMAAEALAKSGLLGLLEASDRDGRRVRIVAYHRVDESDAEPDLEPGLLSATPEDFRLQVEIIASHYQPVSLDDVVAAHLGERPLPPRAVLFSFDDGYRDFAEHAWPTLRALGVPAVLFVPTAFPDSPGPGFWWDRVHAVLRRTNATEATFEGIGHLPLDDVDARRRASRAIRTRVKSLPHDEAMAWLDREIEPLAEVPSLHRVLGWDALRSMAREGLAVCSHSHAHALCTRLDESTLAEDLRRSREIVESELGDHAAPPVLAYPSSASDATSRAAAHKAGYTLALGGGRFIERLPFEDPMNVQRLPMLRYATPLFRAQLRPSVAGLGRILIDRSPGRAA